MSTIANFTVEGPSGAGSVAGNPVAIGYVDGSGNVQPFAGSTTGFVGAHAAVTLAASTTDAVAGAGKTLTAVTGLGIYKQLEILLNVTAAAAAAGDTLDVYIDTSIDGGTSIVNVAHFTQVLGNGGAKKFYATLDPSNPGTAVIAVGSDCAAGVVRPSFFGDWMQVRYTIVDGGAHGQSFTFAVTAYGKA